jgi:hypothetical protein
LWITDVPMKVAVNITIDFSTFLLYNEADVNKHEIYQVHDINAKEKISRNTILSITVKLKSQAFLHYY